MTVILKNIIKIRGNVKFGISLTYIQNKQYTIVVRGKEFVHLCKVCDKVTFTAKVKIRIDTGTLKAVKPSVFAVWLCLSAAYS